MPRFYCPAPLATGQSLELPAGAARHVQVLRLQPGDGHHAVQRPGRRVRGRGRTHGAQRRAGAGRRAPAAGARSAARSAPGRGHAGQRAHGLAGREGHRAGCGQHPAPGRGAQRAAAQRRTRARRSGRIGRASPIAACEQCGRNRVPEIHEVMDMARWLAMPQGQELRLVLSLSAAARPLMQAAAGVAPLLVLSGPGRRPHGARRAGRAGSGLPAREPGRARAARGDRAARRAGGTYTGKMNRNLWLLADLPGPVPHQQRHLHRHQRPGRAGAGTARMDGDAAGDGLRGRRRPVHRHGRAHTAALRPQGLVPAGLGGRAPAPPCCVRTRPSGKHFWLLCFATVVAGYYNANASLYRFAAAELAAPQAREKAVSLVMAGGLLGAVLGPNLAARTRDVFPVAFRRRLRRAGRGGAAGHGACWHSSNSRPAGATQRCAQRPAAWRDHAPTGLHRVGRGRARWASA